MEAYICDIDFYLPDAVLGNAELSQVLGSWTADQIEEKTGIASRHIASEEECASDLGVRAAERLFNRSNCSRDSIDYLLFCTQSPDYFLPTTACLIQERLGLSTSIGALDFNLGCSGYIYGLGLAKGLIQSEQASNVLLIVAETYSKFIHPQDRSVRTLFGDAAAATIVSASLTDGMEGHAIHSFVFGTDGKGGKNLIVPWGGMRSRQEELTAATGPGNIDIHSPKNLYMDGAEIFAFTLNAVPEAIKKLLEKAHLTMDEIDQFVFHQANAYMLEHLRKKLGIPREKFHISMRECGNTVSASIPIALKHAESNNFLRTGDTIMLVGFGVGYSWGATILTW